jgi:hypothetical protein
MLTSITAAQHIARTKMGGDSDAIIFSLLDNRFDEKMGI